MTNNEKNQNRCDKNWGGNVLVWALPNGFFLSKFLSKEDIWRILNCGPYMIDGTRFYMKEWCPNFDPWKHKVDPTPIWIKLYNLPNKYWDNDVLEDIGENLGTLIRVDKKMEDSCFGTYARICLSLMSLPPVPQEIEIYTDRGICKQKMEREE
ncbi:hypothetical protein SUGI_0814260 [Cryptomeria japonica]|nr:hypothetical protein SUGI_0814260 [Cryptomeria japonica]